MENISPNCPDKIKEGSYNVQSTIENSTDPTTETVSTISNQTNSVEG